MLAFARRQRIKLNKEDGGWDNSPEDAGSVFERTPADLERFANDPNIGTLGFWHVEGLKRSAIVRATSAPEAAEKALAADVLGIWELLIKVQFIGIEMPEIFVFEGGI